MKKETKYQDWPESVKTSTALANKNFQLKNSSIATTLGYIVLVLGIIDLIYGLVQSQMSSLTHLISPLSYILVGIASIVSGNSIKWINQNSSWEERFNNTSSSFHKFMYLLVSVILLICIYGIYTT